MDLNKIKEAAQNYEKDMTAFLRAIVKNPGESCDEKAHIETIAAEMKKLDFDEVVIDPQGNVIGYMGTGDKIIAYDAHIDTVGMETSTTGPSIHTRGMRPTQRSADAVYPTSAAGLYPQFTVQGS